MSGLGRWYIEITKQAYWRGVQHLWQNRYVLSGVTPDAADAITCIGAIHTLEDHLFPHVASTQGVGFVSGKAYAASGGPPFATVWYNETESTATATGFTGPSTAYIQLTFAGTLEGCIDVRIPLAGLSSTGKPVFCRKFYRGFALSGAGSEDTQGAPIDAADIAVMAAELLPLTTGLAPNSYVVIGVSGRQPSGGLTVQNYLGNHQVPRGRKRSTTGSTSASLLSKIEAGLVGAAGESIATDILDLVL